MYEGTENVILKNRLDATKQDDYTDILIKKVDLTKWKEKYKEEE